MQPVPHEPSCTVLDIDVSQPLPGKSRRASETISHPAAERPVEPSASSSGELSEAGLTEARRIANELVKLHKAGAIRAAQDPEAAFYASLIHGYGAEFVGKRELAS